MTRMSIPMIALLVATGCEDGGSFVADAMDDGGMQWSDMELTSKNVAPYEPAKLMYAHSGDTLFQIDPTSLTVKVVGKFGPNAPHMNDLAVTPDGQLYAVSSNNLYKVDVTNAQISWVASVPGSVNVALTFSIDGTLMGSDKAGAFRRIDPKTGVIKNVGSYGTGLGSSGDLVGIKNGTLYGVNDVGSAKSNNTLIEVDPKTGVAKTVGSIGFRMVWGLSFWGGTLYGFTRSGEFISIDPKTAKGTLITTFPHEFWGAAVTPKAPLTID